jgi:membrane-associated phospholipid phosphatase
MAKAKRKRLKKQLKKAAGLKRIDLELGAWATRAGRKPPMRYFAQLSELADQPPLLALSLIAFGAGMLRNDPRMKDTGKRMLMAFTAATAAKSTLKATVDRTRPDKLVDDRTHDAALRSPTPSKSDALKSFPSGHTAGAVAIARAVGHNYPRLASPVMTAALALGVLKVFKGDHYPSDVLAGFAVGLVSEGVLL